MIKKIMKRKSRSIIIIVLLMTSLFTGILPFHISESVKATWYDAGFLYNKQVTVTNNILEYVSLINVTNSSGGSVNCSGYANANFSDIRFVLANNTLLPYWIDPNGTVTGSYANIWVKNIWNDTTFNMYYGNASALPVSDGFATFDFFDDFDDNSINTSKWNITYKYGGQYELGGLLLLNKSSNSAPYYGFSSIDSNISYNTFRSGIIEGMVYGPRDVIASVAFRGVPATAINTGYMARIDFRPAYAANLGGLLFLTKPYHDWVAIGGITNITIPWLTWHRFNITVYDDGVNCTMKSEIFNQTKTSVDSTYATNAGCISLQLHYNRSGAVGYTYFDNIRVRPYSAIIPTFTFGTANVNNNPPTQSNPIPANNSVNAPIYTNNLSIDISDVDGNTMNYTIQCNGLNASGNGVANGTYVLNLTTLSYSTTYTWYVNLTDGTVWVNNSYLFTTINNTPPVITNENPVNGSTNQPIAFIWNITINDPDGDLFNWTIQCSDGQNCLNATDINGSKEFELSDLLYNTTYTIYVNATDGYNTSQAIYTFTTRDEFIPGEPTSFNATTISRFIINLSWSKGADAVYTYIEAKLGSYPANPTDGTNIYNGTGTSYSHTGLNPDEHWYYCAWSWNVTDATWSISYAQANTTTTANTPPNFGIPNPANNTIDQSISFTWQIQINDTDGDLFNWSIECNNTQNISANGTSNGTKSILLSGLVYNTTYTIWVNATDGYDLATEWFTFTTKVNTAPVISNEDPINGSVNISYMITHLYVDLTDADGDLMNYTVETSPYVGSKGGTTFNGTQTIIIGGMLPNVTYAWYVNVTDGYDITRAIFTYNTSYTYTNVTIPVVVEGYTYFILALAIGGFSIIVFLLLMQSRKKKNI